MKTLITGANGVLGTALLEELLINKENKICATDIDDSGKGIVRLDICDAEQVESLIGSFRPDIVFHLAAETNVDRCELEPEHAYRINASGVKNIASSCKKNNAILAYISTGAVFDGKKAGPYVESDTTNPINVYGKTKLEGERIIQELLERYYIIRTGWLMGGVKKDKKFVGKIIHLLQTERLVSAVTDKIGSPTFAKDLSRAIIELVHIDGYGLYHIANKGSCSRYEIAKRVAEFMGLKDTIIKAVTSDNFPLAASRPANEAIDNFRVSLLGICKMRSWQEALREYINIWKNNAAI